MRPSMFLFKKKTKQSFYACKLLLAEKIFKNQLLHKLTILYFVQKRGPVDSLLQECEVSSNMGRMFILLNYSR